MAWLVAHVRMLGLDEREKSLQMIRQLAGPLYSENTLQFYNERSVPGPSLLGRCRPAPRSQRLQEAVLPLLLPSQTRCSLARSRPRSLMLIGGVTH